MARTGKRFQETRMEQGYTLSDVSRELDIEVRYLYDLEDEDYDDLPGKTHVIGYAQQYARFLGLNQDVVMAEIMAQTGIDEVIPVPESIGEQILGSEQKLKERQKNLTQITRQAARQRHYLFLIVVVLVIFAVLSFFGSRTWFV